MHALHQTCVHAALVHGNGTHLKFAVLGTFTITLYYTRLLVFRLFIYQVVF